ncbi:triggering receptor expressed on myeloid cells 2-like [Ascaphus truei]|uniref:triggering receptor expressed on myeloid cells 2-like n=1 Tax=Ascaphus truei TaxID=8439 RepID=UPI003F593C15
MGRTAPAAEMGAPRSLLLTCLLGMCLAENVTLQSGHPGDTLTILCPYQQHSDRWKTKMWCREDVAGQCHPVVTARRFWLQYVKSRNGSTSIADHVDEGTVVVTLSHLQQGDAGVYRCRADSVREVKTLQRIRVRVLDVPVRRNISEAGKVQHSLSGFPSESGVPWNAVIVGSSLLLCKALLLGLICSVCRRQHRTRGDPEPSLIASPAESASAGTMNTISDDECPPTYATLGPRSTPVYSNYVYRMPHVNQPHGQI